jgi:hypothetical protein
MLSKCANPSCSNSFHYLRQGKLFQLEIEEGCELTVQRETTGALVGGIKIDEAVLSSAVHLPSERKPAHRIERFWLCDTCAASFTLVYQKDKSILLVPVPTRAQRAAAS